MRLLDSVVFFWFVVLVTTGIFGWLAWNLWKLHIEERRLVTGKTGVLAVYAGPDLETVMGDSGHRCGHRLGCAGQLDQGPAVTKRAG